MAERTRRNINAFMLVTIAVVGTVLVAVAQRQAPARAAAPQAAAQAAPQAAAQAVPQAAAPAAPQSLCGNLAYCYEANDFAALITDFRMSVASGLKVMDVTVRFRNKTNQALILGYTEGSAMAVDDMGNRFILNGYAGANALRGIGKVVNNQIDPKFVLQASGVGDAMFELVWRQGQTEGVNYVLGMTIREISPLEANQFSLGGEFPLQFKGLANGMFANPTSVAPGQGGGGVVGVAGTPATAVGSGGASAVMPTATAAGGAAATGAAAFGGTAGGTGAGGVPCANGTVSNLSNAASALGGQEVSVGSGSAVSSATTAVSNLKSLFGRKKAGAAPNAATPAAAGATTPCVPTTNAAAAGGSAAPGAATGVASAFGLSGGAAAGSPAPAAAPTGASAFGIGGGAAPTVAPATSTTATPGGAVARRATVTRTTPVTPGAPGTAKPAAGTPGVARPVPAAARAVPATAAKPAPQPAKPAAKKRPTTPTATTPK